MQVNCHFIKRKYLTLKMGARQKNNLIPYHYMGRCQSVVDRRKREPGSCAENKPIGLMKGAGMGISLKMVQIIEDVPLNVESGAMFKNTRSTLYLLQVGRRWIRIETQSMKQMHLISSLHLVEGNPKMIEKQRWALVQCANILYLNHLMYNKDYKPINLFQFKQLKTCFTGEYTLKLAACFSLEEKIHHNNFSILIFSSAR